MPKSKSITLRIDEEWFKDLSALAGTFGVSAEEVIRQSLPDVAVTRLFFQCKDYLSAMQWDEVANVGRSAIRVHLRAKYMEGLSAHVARLGVWAVRVHDVVSTIDTLDVVDALRGAHE